MRAFRPFLFSCRAVRCGSILELNASDAFVAAWLPGSEGEGIADVLFRAADGTIPFDFSGRLSFSWPATAMPVKFGSAGTVSGALFATGSGLDYRSSGGLPHLSEEARVPPGWQTPDGSLLHAGRVIAPWSMFVADQGAQVHVTTDRQASPHEEVSVARGLEGIEAQWSGSREGTLLISGREMDLTSLAKGSGAVTLSYRIDRAPEQQREIQHALRGELVRRAGPSGARSDGRLQVRDAPPVAHPRFAAPLPRGRACRPRARRGALRAHHCRPIRAHHRRYQAAPAHRQRGCALSLREPS